MKTTLVPCRYWDLVLYISYRRCTSLLVYSTPSCPFSTSLDVYSPLITVCVKRFMGRVGLPFGSFGNIPRYLYHHTNYSPRNHRVKPDFSSVLTYFFKCICLAFKSSVRRTFRSVCFVSVGGRKKKKNWLVQLPTLL